MKIVLQDGHVELLLTECKGMVFIIKECGTLSLLSYKAYAGAPGSGCGQGSCLFTLKATGLVC
jgi:hypothetical protein